MWLYYYLLPLSLNVSTQGKHQESAIINSMIQINVNSLHKNPEHDQIVDNP